MSPTIKDLLLRMKSGDDFGEAATRIETIIDAYDQPDIDQRFRTDIISMVGATLDLAGALSQRSYNIDEVFHNIAHIQQNISLMLRYGLVARPRAAGYALFNTASGTILPGFYATKEEADLQIKALKALGLPVPITAIPAECVSSSIQRPEETLSQKISALAPPGNAATNSGNPKENPKEPPAFEVPPAKTPPPEKKG